MLRKSEKIKERVRAGELNNSVRWGDWIATSNGSRDAMYGKKMLMYWCDIKHPSEGRIEKVRATCEDVFGLRSGVREEC